MEQLLEKLFESVPKVRLLRLFIQNPEAHFTFYDIVERTNTNPSATKKELAKLTKLTLVKEKNAVVREEKINKQRKKKSSPPPKKIIVFSLNPDFWCLEELKDLVIKSSVASRKRLLRQVKALGKVKLAVISGMFLNNDNARTDLLLVGDDIGKRKLQNFLLQVESELGKSLSYTLMDTDEFKYRMNMYDRFLRDILEYPHEKLINKILS